MFKHTNSELIGGVLFSLNEYNKCISNITLPQIAKKFKKKVFFQSNEKKLKSTHNDSLHG